MNERFEPKKILVPTDFSETAGSALRYASRIAARCGARLLVMHAAPPAQSFDYGFAAGVPIVNPPFDSEILAAAREELQREIDINVIRGVSCDVRVFIGSPISSIMREANDAGVDLIVMGTHGRSGVRRFVLGSVTEWAIRTATVPLITVGPRLHDHDAAELSRVICLVDETPQSMAALSVARTLRGPGEPGIIVAQIAKSDDVIDTADELLRLRQRLPADMRDTCQIQLIGTGNPAEQIVSLAEILRVDAITVGVPSRKSLLDVLQGTCVERIVQGSSCPVIVVSERATEGMRPAPKPAAVPA